MSNEYAKHIGEQGVAEISNHKRPFAGKGYSFIVGETEKRTTLNFLENATVEEMRDVFGAAASLEGDGQGVFILAHAVNDGDEIQFTNSKLPWLHIHAFTGDFSEEFSHIADPEIKSYAVQPNVDFATTVQAALEEQEIDHGGFSTLTFDKNNGGEAAQHDILLHPGYSSLKALTDMSSDIEMSAFRDELVRLIAPTVEEGQGGARIIIDERNLDLGMVAVQVLSGENLDRSGQDSQRYFEKPFDLA